MRRRLTDEARRAVRRTFYSLIDRELTSQEQARVMAEKACDLIDLCDGGGYDPGGWWEEVDP